MASIASGAFCLVRAHRKHRGPDGLGKIFDLNKQLITFDTPTDLQRKVKYYLSHDDKRQEIAQAAHEKLLKNHSSQMRMHMLLETIHNRLSKSI